MHQKQVLVTAESMITGKQISRNVTHFQQVPETTKFPIIEK